MKKEKYCISVISTGEQIISVDYGALDVDVSKDKILNAKNIHVLQACAPEQISCYGYSWINIRHIGCKYSSSQIIEKWKNLAKEGWLLDDIAEKIIISDYKDSLKTSEYHTGIPKNHKKRRVLPSWHYLIKLVDLCLQIENSKAYSKIEGFEKRRNDAKIELNAKLNGNVQKLYKRIITLISELIFISNLYDINLSWSKLKLPNSGSDFQIDLLFIGEKNIEMKTRLKDFEPCEESYEIWELSIPALLIYFAHSSSTKRASKKQKADIIFINIANCYGGHLFRHADPATKKGNLSFEYVFNEAIELVKNNKKGICLAHAQFMSEHFFKLIKSVLILQSTSCQYKLFLY